MSTEARTRLRQVEEAVYEQTSASRTQERSKANSMPSLHSLKNTALFRNVSVKFYFPVMEKGSTKNDSLPVWTLFPSDDLVRQARARRNGLGHLGLANWTDTLRGVSSRD